MSGNSSPVLLIDLDGTSPKPYAEALSDAGFNVVVAAHCQAAFELVNTLTPRLIVVSFDPGTRDGCVAFCEQLRSDSGTRAIPILLTSAALDGDDLRRATDISVLGLTIGPCDGSKLASAVRAVLAVSEGARLPAVMPSPERRVS
jgi:DNA-binding response OmpR family regulator